MDSAKRVTVLHVIDSGGLYGAERVVLSLMEGLRRIDGAPVLCSIGNHRAGDKPIEAQARAGMPRAVASLCDRSMTKGSASSHGSRLPGVRRR